MTEYGHASNSHCFTLTFEEALAIGITTIEEAEYHSNLSLDYYEGYKDVHGIKARWVNYCTITIAELERMCDSLQAEYEIMAKEMEIQEEQDSEKFEAEIAKVIAMGAKDRETAIRWMSQDRFYSSYSIVDYLYENGISVYREYGRKLQKEIMAVCSTHGLWCSYNGGNGLIYSDQPFA
jgi:hypothetical protein